MKGARTAPQVKIRMPPELLEQIRQIADQEMRTMTNQIIYYLQGAVAQDVKRREQENA